MTMLLHYHTDYTIILAPTTIRYNTFKERTRGRDADTVPCYNNEKKRVVGGGMSSYGYSTARKLESHLPSPPMCQRDHTCARNAIMSLMGRPQVRTSRTHGAFFAISITSSSPCEHPRKARRFVRTSVWEVGANVLNLPGCPGRSSQPPSVSDTAYPKHRNIRLQSSGFMGSFSFTRVTLRHFVALTPT